ncbi:hypothetical protein HK405_013027 [Cladochytrium tenue]|nr:hypothetical protein HK405_013027 [Cladochytrium tenue]
MHSRLATAISAVLVATALVAAPLPSVAAADADAPSVVDGHITASPVVAAFAATASLDPQAACMADAVKWQGDIMKCATQTTSDGFYQCVCATASLIPDLQAAFNDCPASDFSAGPTTGGSIGNVPQLYSVCQSLGYTLSSLTNVPTALASVHSGVVAGAAVAPAAVALSAAVAAVAFLA